MANTSQVKTPEVTSPETVFEATPGTSDEVRTRYDRQAGKSTKGYIWAIVILAVAGFIAYSVYFMPSSTTPNVTGQSNQTQMAPAPAAPDNSATPPATNSAPPPADTTTPPATNAAPATPPADATPPASSTSP
jgi:hypothetical protein